MFGAIEAGGTKFVCAVGTAPDDLAVTQFPTTSPEATISSAVTFLKEHSGGNCRQSASAHSAQSIFAPHLRRLAASPPLPNQVGRITISPVQYARLLACRSASIPMWTRLRWERRAGELRSWFQISCISRWEQVSAVERL